MRSKAGEIRSLTGLRGVAALTVVIYHTTSFPIIKSAFKQGYLSVDIFFVLSGFVMAYNYGDDFRSGPSVRKYLSFLWARFARVYPLYFVATLCLLACGSAGSPEIVRSEAFLGTIIANLTLMQMLVGTKSILFPSWSISTEVFAYLAFPILVTIMIGRSLSAAALASSVAFAVYIGIANTPTPHVDDVRDGLLNCSWIGSWWPIARCIAGFSLGILALRMTEIPEVKWLDSAVVETTLTAIVVIAFFVPRADLLFVAATPFLVAALSRQRGPISGFLSWTPLFLLGEWSYSFYLLQPFYFDLRSGTAGVLEFVLSQQVASRTAGASTLMMLVAASWAAYTLIERPARALLRRWDGDRRQLPIMAETAAP